MFCFLLGKLLGEGESQGFAPKETGRVLKQNVLDYLNVLLAGE